jgi:hypothetical protein
VLHADLKVSGRQHPQERASGDYLLKHWAQQTDCNSHRAHRSNYEG